MVQQLLVGQGPLIIEASLSHSDTPHSFGLFWTSGQADTEISTWNTQCSQETELHASGGIRTRSPNKVEGAESRFRTHSHCYQYVTHYAWEIALFFVFKKAHCAPK